MHEHLIYSLIVIAVAGVGAQWLAWRLRIPAIILLILAGFIVGQTYGWVVPSRDFGDLLKPIIAVSVALILFEGGLNLRWHEYKETGVDVNRLVTLNLVLTWVFSAAAAYWVGGLSLPVAIVFGAIIIVTGPTVIGPLLKQSKLQKRPAAQLKWEGIINDPMGALLAVLVFEYFVSTHDGSGVLHVIVSLVVALIVSVIIGTSAGYGLGWVFHRGHVPEYLKSPVLIASALAVYAVVNVVQEEAGLLAVTLFGVVLGNQQLRSIEELRRFKEYITVLLVSALFIILTADIDMAILKRLDWRSAALLGLVIFLIRPLSVFLSTLGTGSPWQERVLLGWIAPRGIVAAAVAGLFAPRLIETGYTTAQQLLPLVFTLIVLTVLLHGLSIGWIARRLGLASTHPNGMLIVGASSFTVGLAHVFKKLDIPVTVSDVSWTHLKAARMGGLNTHHGQILSERSEQTFDMSGISHVLAATANDAYNALVCTHFGPELGQNQVYQLPFVEENSEESGELATTLRGKIAFDQSTSYEELIRRHYQGWQFQVTGITEKYSFQDYCNDVSKEAVSIAVLDENGRFDLFPLEDSAEVKPGMKIVSYVPGKTESNGS